MGAKPSQIQPECLPAHYREPIHLLNLPSNSRPMGISTNDKTSYKIGNTRGELYLEEKT